MKTTDLRFEVDKISVVTETRYNVIDAKTGLQYHVALIERQYEHKEYPEIGTWKIEAREPLNRSQIIQAVLKEMERE